MFDSLKSKLKNVFKKAPAEIADPSGPAPQEEQIPAVQQEQPQLSRKEQKKLEELQAKAGERPPGHRWN